MIDNEREVSALWKLYEEGRGYLSATGLSAKIPLCNRFFEGDQWPAPTKKTQGLPRPVINFVKMIVRNKKSVILISKAKILYKAEISDADVKPLNDFTDYIVKEMGLAELDREAGITFCASVSDELFYTSEMGDVYRFTCPVSNTQKLLVEARIQDETNWEILTWQSVSTMQRNADELLTVWSGDSMTDYE